MTFHDPWTEKLKGPWTARMEASQRPCRYCGKPAAMTEHKACALGETPGMTIIQGTHEQSREEVAVPSGAIFLGMLGPGDWSVPSFAVDMPALPPARDRGVEWSYVSRLDIRQADVLPLDKPEPSPWDPAVLKRVVVEEKQPFPAPSVTSLDPHDAAQPGPVVDLEALAVLYGWRTKVTHAVGHVPHASHGTPSAKAKTSWAIRASRGLDRAVAVRMDGTWTSFWTWSPSQLMVRSPTLADFHGRLA